MTELNVTTPSTVPPSFTVTAVSNFTETHAVLTVATNESASVYYMVLLQSAAVPTAAQVRVTSYRTALAFRLQALTCC